MTYSQTLGRAVVEREVQAIHGRGSTITLAWLPMDSMVWHSPAMDEEAQIPQTGSPEHREYWGGLPGNRGFSFPSLAPESIAGLGVSRHERGGHSFSGLVSLSLLMLGVQSWKRG